MAIGWEQIQLVYSTSKSSFCLSFMVCAYIHKICHKIFSVSTNNAIFAVRPASIHLVIFIKFMALLRTFGSHACNDGKEHL